MLLTRIFQIKGIVVEPLAQIQGREKQAMCYFQTEIELLECRARSHEEKAYTIEQQVEELINQKTSEDNEES